MAKKPDNAFGTLDELKRAPRVPEGNKQLTVIIPEGIVAELKARGAGNGETLRTTVLRALRKDGYSVTDDDLVDRRAQAGKERSATYFRGKR